MNLNIYKVKFKSKERQTPGFVLKKSLTPQPKPKTPQKNPTSSVQPPHHTTVHTVMHSTVHQKPQYSWCSQIWPEWWWCVYLSQIILSPPYILEVLLTVATYIFLTLSFIFLGNPVLIRISVCILYVSVCVVWNRTVLRNMTSCLDSGLFVCFLELLCRLDFGSGLELRWGIRFDETGVYCKISF